MIIRPVRPDDAEALVAIANPIIAETTITFSSTLRTRRAMRAYIAARRERFLVAETAGEVTGYATCAPFRSGSGYARTFEQGKGNTNIVISPDNEYLRNFKNGGGR